MGSGVEMTGCGKFVRFLMFAINFIIWSGSIAILVLGIWTVADRPYLEKLLGSEMYMTAAYILIGTGCVIFFVSFLGCFGALREVKCMLLTYFIIVLLLFIILLIGGILGYVFKDKAKTTVRNAMVVAIKEYRTDEDSPFTEAWDETQQAMKCCAITNQNEWAKNPEFSMSDKKVPKSCCRKDGTAGELMDCQRNPGEDNSYTEGCFSKAIDFVERHALIVGGVGIAVAVIMVLGLLLSIILFKMID
ncbi:CD151 antigen [Procambarus clarkii]|uniref:CD151 antigen n=1 Tax=Procambarus clarkii TaxID=6728 RepID=UPI001E672978|nr:CD151 antigen-like [Procambarus clarkii]XP_045614135.1 CD151 antigen-like [Procambarus clarkii]XP_045614136.1 CD151 antigen-like [Procambarus clarkii]XP_045614137.1 CD151 antigen-like [Procambarus clarkii]